MIDFGESAENGLQQVGTHPETVHTRGSSALAQHEKPTPPRPGYDCSVPMPESTDLIEKVSFRREKMYRCYEKQSKQEKIKILVFP